MLKKIVSNTFAQLIAKFIGAGLTFLTTAIIIRLSGAALFGDLTKSLVLIAVGFTAIDFGLNASVVRALGKSSSPRSLMAAGLTARLLLSVIVVILINLLTQLLPGGYTPMIKSVFWVGSLAIIFQGLYTSMNAWFQFQENYWRSALSTILGTLVGTAFTLYFALNSPTLLHFLLANTLGYLTMALLSIYLGRAVFSLTFSRSRLITIFRDSALLGTILILSVLASKLDTVILGIFRASGEVGEYGFAYRIFDVLLVLPVFIMNAVYPRLIKVSGIEARRLIRSSLLPLALTGVALALLTWFFAPWILSVKPGLTVAVFTLRLLSLSLPIFFLTAPLMWQLITFHHEQRLLLIYALAALGNGLLNLYLVPTYGYLASALLTGATELFILLSLVYSTSSYDQTSS